MKKNWGLLLIWIMSCFLSACGGSGDSATPGTAPPPPVISKTTPGDRQVTIEWSSAAGATSYNLYWSTSPGVTKATGTKISSVTSPYVHSGLTNGTTYY